MKYASALVTLCLAALLLPAQPANEPVLRGFSAESSRAERDWETKYAAIPEPANVRDYMQRLAARPHHVGSPYDNDNAEWILAKLKGWGLDAKIEIFEVLFPTPKDRALEMLEPDRFKRMYPRHVEFQELKASVDPRGIFQSDLSRPVNGQVFVVYGGYIAVMQGWTPAGTLTTDKPWTVDEIEGRRDELFANRESGIPPFIT